MQALSIKNKNIYQRINKIVPLFNYKNPDLQTVGKSGMI